MGRAKEYWMEQQEADAHEEKCEWIREFLEDDEVEEYTSEWYKAEEVYKESQIQMHLDWENLMYEREYEDYWTVEGKTTFQIFNEIIDSSQEIINVEVSNKSKKTYL